MQTKTEVISTPSTLTWNGAENIQIKNADGVVFPATNNSAGSGSVTLPVGEYTITYKAISGKELMTSVGSLNPPEGPADFNGITDAIAAQTEALGASQADNCNKLEAAINYAAANELTAKDNQTQALIDAIQMQTDLLDSPKVVEVVVGCIANPDADGDPLKRIWYVYDDGSVAGPMEPTTVFTGYVECC